jgi:hypothetical protein
MNRAGRVLALLSFMCLAAAPGRAQTRPERRGFWADVQFGYGVVHRSSDQEPRQQQGTFALAFTLGGTLSRYVRLGGQLNGWLLEGFDVWDPAKGVSVSQALAIAQIYPWPARGLFLKVGAGRATYTNHHPFEFGSSGWGGTIGVGYNVLVGRRFALTPMVNYSGGSLGGVTNQIVTVQNRAYSVFDFGIALTYP